MIICFNRYSRIQINILSLLICCLVYFSSCSVLKFISFKIDSISNSENTHIFENFNYIDKNNFDNNVNNLVDDKNDFELSETSNSLIQYNWYLKIPKINLYAEIFEGTSEEILNNYIGHFEESKKESGNVCLAAHNRGYDVNYFSNLKNLEEGDEILYFVNGNEYKYRIDEILVVYETDWTVIENTEEDRITLITCIENRPAYRLCVRGVREE